jgi:hypothetical protein
MLGIMNAVLLLKKKKWGLYIAGITNIFLLGLRKTTRHLSQVSRCSNPGFVPGISIVHIYIMYARPTHPVERQFNRNKQLKYKNTVV